MAKLINFTNTDVRDNKFVYIIKVKGKTKIPDYVQLRDEDYTLLAYFRADRPEKALEKCGLADHTDEIKIILESLPFGKIHKLTI